MMSTTISESFKLVLLGWILGIEWLIRTLLMTFYRLFPFPSLLDMLYKRLSFLRATFSQKLAGPVDKPEFKFSFRDFVLQHGYDVEEHYADTPDGFCLLLFRVLPKRDNHQTYINQTSKHISTLKRKSTGSQNCSYGNDRSVSKSLGPSQVQTNAPYFFRSSPPHTSLEDSYNIDEESDLPPQYISYSPRQQESNDENQSGDDSPQVINKFDTLSPTRYSSNGTQRAEFAAQHRDLSSVLQNHSENHLELTTNEDETQSHTSHHTSLSNRLRRPILLMHGLMMSSDVFVVDKNVSLPLLLVDSGFDVWVGNNRGNKYSWIHKTYKRNDERYWDFSIDELARYDVPTSIHYVLKFTKFSSLAYLGFSNGTAQMFAALSTNTSLNSLVDIFIALAPACKLQTLNPESEIFSLFYPLVTSSRTVFMRIFGKKAMLSVVEAWKNILSIGFFTKLVDLAIYTLFSWKLNNVDDNIRELFFAHIYSTTSTKVVHHWFQMLRSGCFEFYNDSAGADSVSVPEYRLDKISVPVAIIHGKNDRLSDVSWMKQQLRFNEIWDIPLYEHICPLIARDVPQTVFPVVLDILGHRYLKSRRLQQPGTLDSSGGSGSQQNYRNNGEDNSSPPSQPQTSNNRSVESPKSLPNLGCKRNIMNSIREVKEKTAKMIVELGNFRLPSLLSSSSETIYKMKLEKNPHNSGKLSSIQQTLYNQRRRMKRKHDDKSDSKDERRKKRGRWTIEEKFQIDERRKSTTSTRVPSLNTNCQSPSCFLYMNEDENGDLNESDPGSLSNSDSIAHSTKISRKTTNVSNRAFHQDLKDRTLTEISQLCVTIMIVGLLSYVLSPSLDILLDQI